MKLSPQHEAILALHRDKQFHCSTEYEYIRDHRKRVSELNNDGKNGEPIGYLYEKGWILKGVPCTMHNHKGNLFMRRAEKISSGVQIVPSLESWENKRLRSLEWFEQLV